jgi:DNA adenine methylase
MGVHAASRSNLQDYMERLSYRLRGVVVTCGEWDRVLTPAVMDAKTRVGIMLDPPYAPKSVGAKSDLYQSWDDAVSEKVRQWAIENGKNPNLRIALCGYEGEHDMPAGWTLVHWKAVGGYGNQRKDKSNQNAHRERIWFSPYCIHRRLF